MTIKIGLKNRQAPMITQIFGPYLAIRGYRRRNLTVSQWLHPRISIYEVIHWWLITSIGGQRHSRRLNGGEMYGVTCTGVIRDLGADPSLCFRGGSAAIVTLLIKSRDLQKKLCPPQVKLHSRPGLLVGYPPPPPALGPGQKPKLT